MANDDQRRVIVVQADKDGYATALSINEALRQIVEMVYQQEGRRGPISMRDGLTLNAPDRYTQLQIAGTPPFSNAALVMAGTQESSLFVAKGAMMNDNGVWIATDTTAVLLELARDVTTPRVYANSGLSPAQAFTPTLIGTLSIASASIPVFGPSGASHSTGLVPDPGAVAGTTKFLREDASWAAPAAGAQGIVAFGRWGSTAHSGAWVTWNNEIENADGIGVRQNSNQEIKLTNAGLYQLTATIYLQAPGGWTFANAVNGGAYTRNDQGTGAATQSFLLSLAANSVVAVGYASSTIDDAGWNVLTITRLR